MLWDVREDAFVRCTNERKEEGDSQRIQLSSLHQEFTDVSAIIALLCGFLVRRIKCWMPAASRRNDKDEARGWKGDMEREGGLIRLVGKINAVCSKRTGSTPDISCHCSSTEIHRNPIDAICEVVRRDAARWTSSVIIEMIARYILLQILFQIF